MNALFTPCLALIGLWEVVAVCAVLLTMAAVASVVICLIVILVTRKREAPHSPLPLPSLPGSESRAAETVTLQSSKERR